MPARHNEKCIGMIDSSGAKVDAKYEKKAIREVEENLA